MSRADERNAREEALAGGKNPSTYFISIGVDLNVGRASRLKFMHEFVSITPAFIRLG